MKNILAPLLFAFVSNSLLAFGFGDIAKSISEVATPSSQANSALKTRQESLIKKYSQAKSDLANGYSWVLDAVGNKTAASEAKSVMKSIQSQGEKVNVAEVAKLSDDMISKSSSGQLVNIPDSLSDAAKQKYTKGLDFFYSALKGEIDAGSEAVLLGKEVKNLMSSGSNLERASVLASFEPTLKLAKEIPSDISTMKSKISEIVKLARQKGVDIPSALRNLL